MVRTIKNYFHLFEAILANVYYQYPSRDMVVIGVTGTDGKTTTASMIAHILQQVGIKTAVITTIGAYINGVFHETGFHTTTPSSFFLQKYLALAKKNGCTHVVVETTSHALDQHRTLGIFFQIAVITNITHEHLDYHKTIERYAAAKAKLLKKATHRILNFDDLLYKNLITLVPDKNRYFYSLTQKNSVVQPSILPSNIQKLGKYNEQNALAAASVCKLLNVKEHEIKTALTTFKLPEGRLEVVHDAIFKIIVDFAHTPNAFERLLPELTSQKRIIHVFGAAGKRDSTKRKLMGEVASKYDNVIVLTAEDPRGEDVEKICLQIAEGFSGLKQIDPDLIQFEDNNYYVIIPDRKKAISFAISRATKGDVIVVTGKGHEKAMNITGVEEPWSDRETIFELLEKNTKS